MAVGEQPEQQQLERVALADDRLLDLVEDAVREPADFVEIDRHAVTSSQGR